MKKWPLALVLALILLLPLCAGAATTTTVTVGDYTVSGRIYCYLNEAYIEDVELSVPAIGERNVNSILVDGIIEKGCSCSIGIHGSTLGDTLYFGNCEDTAATFRYDSTQSSDTLAFRYELTVTRKAPGHSGGTATCNAVAVCSVCGISYGDKDKNNHVGELLYMRTDPEKHHIRCGACFEVVGDEACSYAKETVIGHWTTLKAEATCEKGEERWMLCDLCEEHTVGGAYKEVGDPLGHNWQSNVDGTHTCTRENCEKKGEKLACTGGTATCTEKAICADCGEAYGDLKAHNYEVTDEIEATCPEHGYLIYTCTECLNSYREISDAAMSHWFGAWEHNGDGMHSALCQRPGCGFEKTVACAEHSIIVGENTYIACPVCGILGEIKLPVGKGKVANVSKKAIPTRGETIIHLALAPVDGVLCAVTVAREAGGEVLPYKGTVRVSVPVELTGEFKLLDAAGAEVACEYADGVLSFETAAAGVFLVAAK